jgi:hypothetical protein
LRQDFEAVNNHLRMLVEQQEASVRHEKELRSRVVAAHDELLRRDEDYRKHSADLQEQVKQTEAWWQAHLNQAVAWWQGQLVETQTQMAILQQSNYQLAAHRDALEARMARIRGSLPGRALQLARKLVRMAKRAVGK